MGGIRSRERQYLQARGPELGAGRTERRSLSPRRGCPPAPSGEPDRETAGKSHQSPTATLRWRWSHCCAGNLLLENAARTQARRGQSQGAGPEGATYLCLGDAVDDGLQRLVAVTLEDSLHAAGPGRQRLAHRHVELVVALLGRQVLDEESKQRHQSAARRRPRPSETAVTRPP